MPKVIYGGQALEREEDQSVLDCLLAAGVDAPYSCRSGTCQTCMMRAVSGEVPERAQAGLKDVYAAQNYFLPCVCYPEGDLEITDPGDVGKLPAEVTSVESLGGGDILGIRLKPLTPLDYRAGQFIRFFKDEHLARNYSLASVPALDDELSLHVRKVPGGLMTGWLFDHLKTGDTVTITEAAGDCLYVSGKPEQNLLLIGTGTGLAPLYGIIRDALYNSHRGEIRLYHGSVTPEGLYLDAALRELAQQHPNFHYIPCVSGDNVPANARSGMVLDGVFADLPKLNGWRVFLCGHPEMVKSGTRKAFFAGASMNEIHADAFT
ncbi:MAG: 2Fe-2S iron-sulfur cluster binding domain-containing protein [Gallionellaceae bacterium]|jgi:NAD(P)H-flavin reductase/ferredoxin|nr:2Fe-2S iron-sulfur cluster binding domain-containing protein [Gallionellaceae bacterium]